MFSKNLSFLCVLLLVGETLSLRAEGVSTPQPCSSCSLQTSLKDRSETLIQKTLTDLYQKEVGEVPASASAVPLPLSQKGRLYVFVSLSLSQQGLIDLGQQAKRYGGVLVLRGLLQGSYQKTALYLKDFIDQTGTGVIIDPLLFRQYDVQAVPSIVLASISDKAFDKVGGFIPVRTALETIAKKGERAEEAAFLLKKRAVEEKRP